ncbi:hypothetical protein CAMSH0001_2038 [Campylobacter showae RM3277]|uniref:Uncharacterized protein n=1 Tax=Campylobacter showae RM3277 TaxID=553219 RepID=C6REE6_9BACT|nr:hypothetical protein CAMSH0001_2038 [Campylobacter showae RM3277]
MEFAQYFGIAQILGAENQILKIIIADTFDLADVACRGRVT